MFLIYCCVNTWECAVVCFVHLPYCVETMLCNTQQRQTASNYTQTYGDNSVEAANTNLNTNLKTNPNTNPNTNPKTNPNTNIVTTVMLSQWASHGVVWHLTHYTSSALDHICVFFISLFFWCCPLHFKWTNSTMYCTYICRWFNLGNFFFYLFKSEMH